MNAYQRFAYYYDDLFSSLDYTEWLNFIEPYLEENSSILDLACGSGTLAILLNLKGYKVEGLDLSSSIIEIAREKAKMNHLSIPFHIRDMTQFTLNQKFDVITCFFDSVNFLKTKEQINALQSCVERHLNENGLFIFDIFSKTLLDEYQHNKVKIKEKTHKIKWKTKKIDSTTLRHSILIQEGKLKQKEIYFEYYHPLEEFSFEGFETICISGDFKKDLTPESQRILVVLKKTTAN